MQTKENMSQKDRFCVVGIREQAKQEQKASALWYQGKPLLSMTILGIFLLGCLCCELFMTKDPTYMDLEHGCIAPGREFFFGTDTMGRDLFSMIWYGGRVSLLIGFLSTVISTVIAALFGTASGLAPRRLDAFMMRFTEIFLSLPNLLVAIFLQAIFGECGVLSLSVVVGITSWAGMAKVVRAEVRQLRKCEYVIVAKCMGGGFFHILRHHLAPNFFSSILFMIVMNIRNAIVAESALSFMGIGLPLEVISWGSMLSLSEGALLAGAWWMIVIPGGFLVTTLLCVTEIAEYLRKGEDRKVRHR